MVFTIGLIGKVSAGKTTLLNYFLGNYYGETSKKKTTHVPSFFKNTTTNCDSIEIINKKIQQFNDDKEGDADKLDFLDFNVFIPQLAVNNNDIKLVDFPGLDDDEGIEKHFDIHAKYLDVIIFVTDANSSMNTKSERDVFTTIVRKVCTNHQNCKYTNLIIAFNKYDDDEDDELNQNITAAKLIIDEITKNESITTNYFKISSIKMMVKKTLENDRKAIKLIPSQVLKNVLIQYHGIKKAKAILKKKLITKNDLKEIDITKDEEIIIKHLQKISKPSEISKLYSKKFSERISSLILSDEIITQFQKYLDLHYGQINNQIWIREEITKKIENILFDEINSEKHLTIFSDIFMILFKGVLLTNMSNNLYIEYSKTPKELIVEMTKINNIKITNSVLIDFAITYEIENFIELSSDKNELFNLIKDNPDAKHMLDKYYVEEINQYNDYLLIQNNPYLTISHLYMIDPLLMSKIIINYINNADIETSLSRIDIYNIMLHVHKEHSITGSINYFKENSISCSFKLVKENIHRYPSYIKLYLNEIHHPIYMDFINEYNNVDNKVLPDNDVKYFVEKNDIEYDSNELSSNDSEDESCSDNEDYSDNDDKVKHD